MFKRMESFGSHYAHPTDELQEHKVNAIIIYAKNIVDMDPR